MSPTYLLQSLTFLSVVAVALVILYLHMATWRTKVWEDNTKARRRRKRSAPK